MYGRRVITTDVAEINESNVLDELGKAINAHSFNKNEIEYLYNYYKGKQPILDRIKEIRPEINNKIVENRANEIVTFKVSYSFGKPIQYINRSCNDSHDRCDGCAQSRRRTG
jgi:hypothetical protein